ncbi:hypothetical protein F4777DRAFT_516885 [Nemania sp. FL0916]|nr:hypothetical protein F4777DRAFT_516885 [Nemania sp. FL0916]
MADCLQINLKTFEVSSRAFDLSLSMTSVAFLYDVPILNVTQDDLLSLIQSKQLWLLPCGTCRLDVHVQLDEFDSWQKEQDGFFEFIADTIYQSSVWSQLGLSLDILDIQYHWDEGDLPNLYFSIEQPDMSSALLSPPHTSTAHIKGLECILHFKNSGRPEIICEQGQRIISDVALSSNQPGFPTGDPSDRCTVDAYYTVETWDNAASLIEAALCLTFGTRRRIPKLTTLELEEAPSLLDLAPAVWNSRYLKSTVSHAKHFAVISNILGSSLRGQSPDLRSKGAEILQANMNSNMRIEISTVQLESSVYRLLWSLLQHTLKPTIGTDKTTKPAPLLPDAELEPQYYEFNEAILDDDFMEQNELPDEVPKFHEDLLSPLDQDVDVYQSIASSSSDFQFEWQQGNDRFTLSQDIQMPGTPSVEDGIEYFYDECSTSGSQLLEPWIQQLPSDPCNGMENHAISNYTYDGDHDIYEQNYDALSIEQSYTGCELQDLTFSWEDQGECNMYEGVVDDSIPPAEADEMNM